MAIRVSSWMNIINVLYTIYYCTPHPQHNTTVASRTSYLAESDWPTWSPGSVHHIQTAKETELPTSEALSNVTAKPSVHEVIDISYLTQQIGKTSSHRFDKESINENNWLCIAYVYSIQLTNTDCGNCQQYY